MIMDFLIQYADDFCVVICGVLAFWAFVAVIKDRVAVGKANRRLQRRSDFDRDYW